MLRQILAELRKKPGTWELRLAGGEFKVDPGKVFEVYVSSSSADVYLNGRVVSSANSDWAPYFLMTSGSVVAQWTGQGVVPEIFDATDYVPGIGTKASMFPQGWILSGGEVLTAAASFLVRFRRRFDLET